MNRSHRWLMAAAAVFSLATATTIVCADERPYSEGPVVNVSSIRTTYGMYDEYMKFLAGPWKQEQEALKKAGLILSYEVLNVEPRGPNDPDLYLVITYKNWGALDGLADKSDAVSKQVYGSMAQSNAAAVDRGKMRTVLGSATMQVLNLK